MQVENPDAKQCAQGESEGTRYGFENKRPRSRGIKSRPLSIPRAIRLAFEIISIRGPIRPTLCVALEGAISHNNCVGSVSASLNAGTKSFRSSAGASLRRFLVKCRARYHFSLPGMRPRANGTSACWLPSPRLQPPRRLPLRGFAIDLDRTPHDLNPALVTGLQIVGDGVAATQQRIVGMSVS